MAVGFLQNRLSILETIFAQSLGKKILTERIRSPQPSVGLGFPEESRVKVS